MNLIQSPAGQTVLAGGHKEAGWIVLKPVKLRLMVRTAANRIESPSVREIGKDWSGGGTKKAIDIPVVGNTENRQAIVYNIMMVNLHNPYSKVSSLCMSLIQCSRRSSSMTVRLAFKISCVKLRPLPQSKGRSVQLSVKQQQKRHRKRVVVGPQEWNSPPKTKQKSLPNPCHWRHWMVMVSVCVRVCACVCVRACVKSKPKLPKCPAQSQRRGIIAMVCGNLSKKL